MKILYLVLDAGIPVHGPKGASGHVRAICESLADIGHDVEVVARDVGGDEGLKNDVHVVPLPSDDSAEALASVSGETRKELRDLFQNTSAYTFLVDVAKSTGPDFILERLSLFSLAGLAAARSTKTPYFLEVDAPLVEEASLYRGLTLGETARAIERAVVRGADLVFPVSTTLREWAVRLGAPPERVHVLHNGVDTGRFDPARAKDRRRELALEDAKVIGFVGGLRPWHGVNMLMKAFDQLAFQDDNTRLLVVGDGPARKDLEQWRRKNGLDDRVLITGHVPQSQVPDFLATMDVVLAPYEKLPNFYFSPLKILESMAMGRATVATAIGDIPQLLMDGQTGLLVPPGDSKALAEATAHLLHDTKLAAQLGAKAREHIVNHHDWQRVAKRLEEYAITGRSPMSTGIVQDAPLV